MMDETSLLIMKLWRSAGAGSTWVVLSAQRYADGLFSLLGGVHGMQHSACLAANVHLFR